MNPFEFFEIVPSFQVDQQALRRMYLANQRKWHPDFHAGNPEMHNYALEKTAANNEAYAILTDTYTRIKCILSMHQMDVEKEPVLPPDFLMEMMDLSDVIEEAHLGNLHSREQAEEQLVRYFQENESAILTLSAAADDLVSPQGFSNETLLKAAALYQQHKYLSRLRKNLTGIKEL